ncbi:putative clathrin assembly protein [Senna tora]|uniref:Putative clathrin assembly protein n=1 Tax=Senna tora TaxID=362788 RepID=A0A834TG74_9FABA|nr:putative clathrin assembly protein [Senna tora]
MGVVDIQGKLRLALGSVKDHASIGKAMIMYDGFSSIEIAVLKATAHNNDTNSIHDRHMHEILFLVSNSGPGSIPFLAEKLSRRLHKTKDRLVALKALVLIHRLLRGGNRRFEQELCRARFSGHLQIGTRFGSDRFLHKYASYLEERMNWVINQAGRLEPIVSNKGLIEFRRYDEKCVDMVFRTLPKCQVLLDRVLDCDINVVLPCNNNNNEQYGFMTRVAAMSNTLRESFQVYTTFAEGVAVLVNMLFDLTESARGLACDILRKASIQSRKLHDLYQNCKKIVEINSKNLEFPCVEIISMDHIMALDQCLRNDGRMISKAPSSCDRISEVEKVAKAGKRKSYNKNSSSNVEEKKMDMNLTPSAFLSWTLETKISKDFVKVMRVY